MNKAAAQALILLTDATQCGFRRQSPKCPFLLMQRLPKQRKDIRDGSAPLSSLAAPILFGFALHRWRFRGFELSPPNWAKQALDYKRAMV